MFDHNAILNLLESFNPWKFIFYSIKGLRENWFINIVFCFIILSCSIKFDQVEICIKFNGFLAIFAINLIPFILF